MKNPLLLPLLGAALLLVSCAPYPYYPGPGQATGSVIGAAAGGVAGAFIGNNNCNPVGGALLGAALGGAAGSALGYANDVSRYGPPRPAPVAPYPYYYGAVPAYPYPPPAYYAAPSVSFAYVGGSRCYPYYGGGGGACYGYGSRYYYRGRCN